jgi:hypothetical protein
VKALERILRAFGLRRAAPAAEPPGDARGVVHVLAPAFVDIVFGDPPAPPTLQELLCATGGCRALELDAGGRVIEHAPGCAKFTAAELEQARKDYEVEAAADALRCTLAAARAER